MKTHKSITPKAAKLLPRVAKRILKHHKEYNQDDLTNECGSGCCILGHMWLIIEKKTFPAYGYGMFEWAYKQIDKDYSLEEATLNLFSYAYQWPDELQRAYRQARSSKARARVGYRRIMHYLRTGE